MKSMKSNNSYGGYLYFRSVRLYYLLIALVALFLTLCTARGVWAHSGLEKSEPEAGQVLSASPAQVKAWFSEELESDTSTLQVFNSLGEQVDQGDGGVDLNDVEHTLMVVGLPASLPADTYTVRWAAVSAEDGDATMDEFSFTVQNDQINDAAAPVEQSSSPALTIGIITIIVLVAIVVLAIIITRYISLRRQNKRA